MNFVVQKSVLEQAVLNASLVIDKKPTIPAYGLISFHTYDNGFLVSAHGPELSVQTFVDAPAVPGLAFGVDGVLLSDIVKRVKGDEVALTVDKTKAALQLKSSGIKVDLGIVDEDNFLAPHNYQNMPFIKTNGLLEAIKAVSYAASDDETRVQLMGVLINDAEVVAVDGHRMSVKSHGNNLSGALSPNSDTILPAVALDRLGKIFRESEINIFSDDSSVHFNNGKVAASVRKIAREFPRYKSVIPVDGYDELHVKKKEFVDAIDFVRIVTDKARTINVDLDNGSVRIWSQNDKVSNIEQFIEGIFNNKVEISFNSDYLLDVAKRLKNDTIVMEVRGGLKPLVIREGDSLHVVMPKKRI